MGAVAGIPAQEGDQESWASADASGPALAPRGLAWASGRSFVLTLRLGDLHGHSGCGSYAGAAVRGPLITRRETVFPLLGS